MFKKLLPLILILLLAATLRLYNLDKAPSALFGDEIDVGYQAYSILQTGRDIQGNFLPIYIRSIAEYRAPAFIYSAVPFVGIFGLNEWGVRLPAVFWGVLSILGLFLLAGKLFNSRVAVLSAGILAISPWHLQYSRASFEVTMLIALIVFGVYFFLLGMGRRVFWPVSALLFGLTFYVYSTATVFVPLLVLLLVFLHKDKLIKDKKTALISIFVLVLTLLPITWSVYKGEARERFGLVSIFQDSVLLDKINIARRGQTYFTPEGESRTISPKEEAIFHNKPTIFAQVFTLNYLRAFSPGFLFTDGDPNFRQSIHEMGVLYPFELIFIFFGVWFLIAKGDPRGRNLIFGWLLLAPIPAALTFDGGFHATRLFLMTPPLALISGLGAWQLISLWQKKQLKLPLLILLAVAVVNIVFYLHRYHVHYPIESWRWWHIGYKESMTYIKDNQDRYQIVVINNSYEPSLERYLFYTKYDPALFQKQYSGDKIKANVISGIDGFTFDNKVFFGTLSEETQKTGAFEKAMKPGMLYLAAARDEAGPSLNTFDHQAFRIIKTIVSPAGDPIFYLMEGK